MFDPSAAKARVDRLWKLKARFGIERGNTRIFLDELVSDRLQLLHGLQVLRDELQFAKLPAASDLDECGADLSLPSVVTTLAYTNCGDRIHHGEVEHYQRVVASRFATLSELGTLKAEAFHPTGGGIDDGATLAHVTWAHVLDEPLRKRVYEGNRSSFILCAFDLKSHVGRAADGSAYGRTRESKWREPRAACGAVVGTLWRIPDGDSSALMTLFHERIVAGDGPVRALAASQRSLVARGASTAAWAAFSTVSVSLERR